LGSKGSEKEVRKELNRWWEEEGRDEEMTNHFLLLLRSPS